MRRLRSLLIRLLNSVRRTNPETEVAREFASNLEFEIEEYVAEGVSPAEARRLALARSGGMEAAKDAYRDQHKLPVIETLLQDARYAFRSLRCNPAFSLIAIGTLALGIGTTTAMFGVVHAILLRPLPYRAPDRLIRLTETNPLKKWTMNVVAPANYADWRKSNKVFTDLAAWQTGDVFLSGSGSPERIHAASVTGNLFTVLGVEPAMGRGFREQETYAGNDRVVILSHDLWRSRFAADPRIIGRTITIAEVKGTVVGVMPQEFFFPNREVKMWSPLGLPYQFFVEHRRPHYLNVLGRLKRDVSLAQAADQMTAIALQLEQKFPGTNTKMGVRLDPFHDAMFLKEKKPLLTLMAAVGLLFLIVCSNLANLLLGRSAARAREFSIRRALGAGRARLAHQLLTESFALSIPGGLLGIGVAMGLHTLLIRLVPTAIPTFAEIRLDTGVLLFALVITILAPLLFGLFPAFLGSTDGLRDRSGIASLASRSFRAALVTAEVALAVILVTGSALLVQSLAKLQAMDLGFQPASAMTFSVQFPFARFNKASLVTTAVASLENSLQGLPGVESVGASDVLPLHGNSGTGDATPEGRAAGDYERELRTSIITASYFQAAGTKLLSGRVFNGFDTASSEMVLVVNRALERVYFRGQPAVGKRLKLGRPTDDRPFIRIVGVVEDIRQETPGEQTPPMAYVAIAQRPTNRLEFVVRGRGVDGASIRKVVATVDPALPLADLAPLRAVVNESLVSQRFRTALLSGFAVAALFLAALGIYGVLAWSVSQRSREIGVRLALGASQLKLFASVVSQGMLPVVAGAAIGLLASLASTRLLQTLLFGIQPHDLLSYVSTAGILILVALAACMIPALRATQIDPVVALRE